MTTPPLQIPYEQHSSGAISPFRMASTFHCALVSIGVRVLGRQGEGPTSAQGPLGPIGAAAATLQRASRTISNADLSIFVMFGFQSSWIFLIVVQIVVRRSQTDVCRRSLGVLRGKDESIASPLFQGKKPL